MTKIPYPIRLSEEAKIYWDTYSPYFVGEEANPLALGLFEHVCEVAHLARRVLEELRTSPFSDPDKKDPRLAQYAQYCLLLNSLSGQLRRIKQPVKSPVKKKTLLGEKEQLLAELESFEGSL